LQTVLCEIEAVINQRPLCYTSDEDIGESLTPNHLLFGKSFENSMSNKQICIDNVADCKRRVKHVQTTLEHFWKRFSNTYLNELRQHHTYRYKRVADPTLSLNDVVLIRDDIPLPRSRWKIGKVEKLVLGNDGKVRGAKLKVITNCGKPGHIHRPIQKLIPFEIGEKTSTEDIDDDLNHIGSDNRSSEIGDACDEPHRGSRIPRRAAIDGQCLRRLKSKIY